MQKYSEILQKLKELKNTGFVRTHREGNTGIGKTLEDLLGIRENNIPGPDAEMIELKSARKNASSMLTLFTKSPLPRSANSSLLRRFGYPGEREGRELHTTVNALSFNSLKGRDGFKIIIENDKIGLVSQVTPEILCYWDKDTLQRVFETKLPQLLYVKADCRGSGSNEEFWFNEVWLLGHFNFDNFINLLRNGTIVVDIRIGQYEDGSVHDHGTGFRIFPDKLDLCFANRERVV